VTFLFLPGRAGDAMALYRERAIPLYRRNDAMLSFRGLREVESPVALDLVVVSAFRGMRGMDESNASLRMAAASEGTSIGEIYGAIGTLSSSHDDQFVAMLPALGNGDPSSKRLVALVWYQTLPGRGAEFEEIVERTVGPWERDAGVPASTGRFLVSDGWHYLRFLGFDSLADYETYRAGLASLAPRGSLDAITARSRQVILAPVPELSVR